MRTTLQRASWPTSRPGSPARADSRTASSVRSRRRSRRRARPGQVARRRKSVRERSEAHGLVTAVSSTSITVEGPTCAVPTGPAAEGCQSGGQRRAPRSTARSSTPVNTLTRIEAKHSSSGRCMRRAPTWASSRRRHRPVMLATLASTLLLATSGAHGKVLIDPARPVCMAGRPRSCSRPERAPFGSGAGRRASPRRQPPRTGRSAWRSRRRRCIG